MTNPDVMRLLAKVIRFGSINFKTDAKAIGPKKLEKIPCNTRRIKKSSKLFTNPRITVTIDASSRFKKSILRLFLNLFHSGVTVRNPMAYPRENKLFACTAVVAEIVNLVDNKLLSGIIS